MKYFIDATIFNKTLETVKQKLEYDVNFENTVTLASAKAELSPRINVPNGYRLIDESFQVVGRKRDLTFELAHGTTVMYTATLEEITKEKKQS